ncbi:putative NPH3 domain-containing protein [Helianthus annuus]|nr:putative NPH3 domain-containing protein [Helianthus annuus]
MPNLRGTESFELCAKFCYGIKITISAHNIVSARCASRTPSNDRTRRKRNLVYKLDAFFNSCILNGWKDSIVTLQTTKSFQLWSEEAGITSCLIEAIASKVISNPLKVNLSRNYSKQETDKDDISGWWGDALRIYASKRLQNVSKNLENDQNSRLLLESVVSLLPTERSVVSCSFLLKLLKAANILGASSSSRAELAQRIATQLDEATVQDLLIPSCSCSSNNMMMTYDVEVVLTILEHFMLQSQSPRARHVSRGDSSGIEGQDLKIMLILRCKKFTALVEVVPDFARLDHDDLYNAIDNYLKVN